MNVHRLAASVIVRAPAKLNLFFEVLAQRGDGFHEIETLMVPISLYDTLAASSTSDGKVHVACRWAGGPLAADLPPLPPPEQNLAARAAEKLRARAGIGRGIRIELIKRIPSQAGLGGGSSDAAAALVAANAVWNLGWSRQRLAEVAAELGSDVPFFLNRPLADGCPAAVCRGRGELVVPCDSRGIFHFVVAYPPAGLSTAEVYARCQVPPEPRSVVPMAAAMFGGDTRRAARLVHNRLEPAAASLSPWVERLQREFAREDCLAARMSGSGSSYFGICRHARHAQRTARRLRARRVGRVYALSTSN